MRKTNVKIYFEFSDYIEFYFAMVPRVGEVVVLPAKGSFVVMKVLHYPGDLLTNYVPEIHLYVIKDWTS